MNIDTRKVISISNYTEIRNNGENKIILVALCDDGTLWSKPNGMWVSMEVPPQPYVPPVVVAEEPPKFEFCFYPLQNKADLTAKHYTCFYCGLTHERVEAGGIYHCPNPACMGCGVYAHMKNLKSYRDYGSNGYQIDDKERIEYCQAFADHAERHGDPDLADHVRATLKKQEKR